MVLGEGGKWDESISHPQKGEDRRDNRRVAGVVSERMAIWVSRGQVREDVG